MRRATDFAACRHLRGVTLIEMIVAIVVTGILLSMVSLFTRNQITAYFDVAARAELADAADTALRRTARDLQAALANSVRLSGNFLEFVPIKDAGRYRAQSGGGSGQDPLYFTDPTDHFFDVFGPPVNVTGGDQLVIYNLGIPGSDVYAGSTRRAITSAAGAVSNLSYAVGGVQFPLASPQNRFQIVGGPVTFECAPNAISPDLGVIRRRWCYAYTDPQPTAFGSLATYPGCSAVQSAVLVAGVSACAFAHAPGALQRNGLVSMSITLTRNHESVTLLHQVDVMNTP